jgi:hypothetical protein
MGVQVSLPALEWNLKFLNCVANGKGGVWGGIFHLLLFFWRNSGRAEKIQIQNT